MADSFKQLYNRKPEGEKGAKAKGVGIGKEFDRGAAIILTWVQRGRTLLPSEKGGMRGAFPP
jgi:hypothetical protein